MTHYRRMAQLRSAAGLRAYLDELGIDLPFDETVEHGPDAALAQPLTVGGKRLTNRFAVLPMEGWDGSDDGHPTERVRRRWQHFGQSGAKLIWGGEAVAVRHDGRANPRQLMLTDDTFADIATLRALLIDSHRERYGGDESDLLIGLQLTHSGRFCRPNDNGKVEPFILYHHPILDAKYGLPPDYPLMTDDEIARLIEDFIRAAQLVHKAGFDFVDLKHCHGYLGHEFLTAYDREGRYGGSFENRTRFLRELVEGVRAEAPGLGIGVRLSAIDLIPFKPSDEDRRGEPVAYAAPYRYAFGSDAGGLGLDLTEPFAFLDLLHALNIPLVNITAGSPYYNPHVQRPALFPPSDGYLPPEDPLVGVARQIAVTRALKQHRPELTVIGSGYSYLQEWLPNVAQHAIRTGGVNFIGLGRMTLSYPELAADILAGRLLQRKRLCRTFSDCTTAPRIGLRSGCYPLDDFYSDSDDAQALEAFKHPK